jgi:hypothetical protein
MISYFSGFFSFGENAGDTAYQPDSGDESARFFMINSPIIFYNSRQTEVYVCKMQCIIIIFSLATSQSNLNVWLRCI